MFLKPMLCKTKVFYEVSSPRIVNTIDSNKVYSVKS